MRSIPIFRRPVIDTLLLSCLLAACGGASNEALLALETAEARKSNPRSGQNSSPPPTTVSPPPTSTSTLPDGSLAWSSPATWGGTLPPAGAEIVIPAGKVITLDTSPPTLAGVRIEGTLRFARADVSLTAGFIDVTGALEIGTAAQPFTHKAIVTLNGAPQSTNDGVARGLNVRGGRLELYGAVPTPVWTKLNDHANAGTTTLTLRESTNWKAGDTIAIAPTDFYGVAATERIALSSTSGAQLGLAAPLAKFRWGKMQYVTNAGMSLTPDPAYVPPATPAPTELDQRAAVGNLTRNIVIQGADDSAWQTAGFGAHVMVMGLASKVTVDGVEIRRAGQAGHLARYPFHWHMLSYAADGTMVGDAVGHVLRNSAIWNTSQRCVVLHATNGVQVLNNICQDVKGHAFFMEDGVERRNVLDGNLALMTRAPVSGKLMQLHEGPEVFQAGPSGFWLTNPDNTVRNNLAGDAQGNGFWMAIPRKALGLSAAVRILPDRLAWGVFENNTAHTARGPGLLLNWVPVDDAGNVEVNMYTPTADGTDKGERLRFALKRNTSFKNLDGAYRNVASNPDYVEWVTADNVGVHFHGKVDDGSIVRGLMVGTSLNNVSPLPPSWLNEPPAAFATYHSMASMQSNTLVNFAVASNGKPSGVFSTLDYYITAVDRGPWRNTSNRLVQSHAGYRMQSPNLGPTLAAANTTLSGAIWDPHGYWGQKGNYWVFDIPFLTHGSTCQNVAPAGLNGKSCDGEFIGIGELQTNFDTNRYNFTAPISVVRWDPTTSAQVGSWSVGTNGRADGFRHFAVKSNAQYTLSFPNHGPARSLALNVTNGNRASDSFTLGVSFDANTTPAVFMSPGKYRGHPISEFMPGGHLAAWGRILKPVASMAALAASAGDAFWQDKANSMLWVKYRGGLPSGDEPVNSDGWLYQTVSLVVTAQ